MRQKTLQLPGLADAPEVEDARLMKQRLYAIETRALQLDDAMRQRRSADEVSRLVTSLVELGAWDHPMVAQGEQYANRQAQLSQEHSRKIQDCKRALWEAATQEDLLALIRLEADAQSLGITRDPDVEQWLEQVLPPSFSFVSRGRTKWKLKVSI